MGKRTKGPAPDAATRTSDQPPLSPDPGDGVWVAEGYSASSPTLPSLCSWNGTSVGTERGMGQHAPVGILGVGLQGHLRTLLEVVDPHGMGSEHGGVRAHLRPFQRLLRHPLGFGLGGCWRKGRVRAGGAPGDKDTDRRDGDSKAGPSRSGSRSRGQGPGRVGVGDKRKGGEAASPPGRARGRGRDRNTGPERGQGRYPRREARPRGTEGRSDTWGDTQGTQTGTEERGPGPVLVRASPGFLA